MLAGRVKDQNTNKDPSHPLSLSLSPHLRTPQERVHRESLSNQSGPVH